MKEETVEISFKPLDPSVMRLMAYLCKETGDDLEESFARLVPAMMMAARILELSDEDVIVTIEDLGPMIDEAMDVIEQRGIAELEKMEAAGTT